jgi:hypothetical protein
MTAFTIIKTDPNYYTLMIEFDGLQFSQEIYSTETGDDLQAFMQNYADAYESVFLAYKGEVL